MIVVVGGEGFIGQRIMNAFQASGLAVQSIGGGSEKVIHPAAFADRLNELKATHVINAAGFTGRPNVDACEDHKAACLTGNAVLPGIIRESCEQVGIPFSHVSSGCIYQGQRADGAGFAEEDPPNFCFRTHNGSFYSGSKALGEEVLEGCDSCYVWRLRMPFDHIDGPRNYLSKLQRYERLLDVRNSLTHLGDFTASCVQCIDDKLPFGTYNMTNPGSVTTREVVEMIRENLGIDREFRFFDSEDEFMRLAAKTPRSHCVLDASKVIEADLPMRPIRVAISDALRHWEPEPVEVSR